jgi:ATP-dependent Clp protease, protease subunit
MAAKKIDGFNANDRVGVRLLENSVHFLVGDICEDNVYAAVEWIVYENLDVKEERLLTLYINSTGGDLYQAFALIDIMRNSQHPIRVIGIGAVMSAAFLIFAAGTKGERYAARNCSFMSHQYSETFTGKHHDLKATMKEGDSYNTRMVELLKEASGLAVGRVRSKLLPASDVYLTAQEVVDLGIADHIIE